MKPTLERLSEQFTQLIGPAAFAKAEAAIAAAQAAEAAAAAAKAAAAAAKATAPMPAAATTAVVAGLGEPGRPGSATPATVKPAVTPPAIPRPTGTTATVPPRPATPAPSPAPLPTLPVQAVAHAAKGYDFDAVVAPGQVVLAAQILDREGFALDAITGVDWIAQNEMEVVYDYFHPTRSIRVVVRTRVSRADPALPTIVPVFAGANWHERETHDFFGIRFSGHPNLKPFLLPEDADFHPLRKDYQP